MFAHPLPALLFSAFVLVPAAYPISAALFALDCALLPAISLVDVGPFARVSVHLLAVFPAAVVLVGAVFFAHPVSILRF